MFGITYSHSYISRQSVRYQMQIGALESRSLNEYLILCLEGRNDCGYDDDDDNLYSTYNYPYCRCCCFIIIIVNIILALSLLLI